MDSSGQAVSTNPLFNAAAGPSGAADKAANSSSNALNNKKFSDVLDKQKAADKVAPTNRSERPSSDSLSAAVQGVEDAVDGMAEGFQLQIMAEGGKSLPAEGFALPLLTAAGAFTRTEFNVKLAGETLAATPQQPSEGLNVDSAALMPELNAQGFVVGNVVVGNVAAETGLVGFNPSTANQAGLAASAAPLAGLQIMGQGYRGEGLRGETQKGPVSISALNASTTGTPALSAGLDADVLSQPVAGLVANSSATANASADLTSQLQSSLAQASVFAVDSSSSGATSEAASSFNTLLASETPQAYRASAQASIQAAVPVEVGKPGWSDTVMERVMWMSSQQINKAEIALDPPELGPLQVRISTNGDQTTVSFTSQHGTVRDALDQGLPRLREMMDSQGLNLADVDVSDQHQQQQSQAQTQENNSAEAALTDASVDIDGVNADQQTNLAQPSEMKPLSLIDQYV